MFLRRYCLRPGGRGRPRSRPDRLIADKGYSYPRCRRLLRRRHIPHTIPERRDQRARRAARQGRPLAFDKTIYARRNVVERCINRLKQWRGLGPPATRSEPSTTGRWWCWPPSSSGWSRDSSDTP